MPTTPSRALDRLRQPEYTGENRCIPCTVVNVLIALVLSLAVGFLVPPVGFAVFALSLLAIYFRGYLVPGTPALTKRYFPDWLLAKFEKAPPGYGIEGDGLEADDSHGPDPLHERETRINPEETLVSAGVVEPCADVDDLCLEDDAHATWRAAIEDRREGDRAKQVAAFLDAEPDKVDVRDSQRSNHVVVRVDGRVAARWESDAALLADVAGFDLLEHRVENWEALTLEQRSQLVSGLRAFLETCPTCSGTISIDAETVESCCRSYEVYAVTCEDCDARLLEVDA
ncbi:hypothetical protein ACLI4U_14325 [Natrialbaceae archaeon A-CW2]|uniref:hypothetical protein n=1 Tax=Natronosalvus amylolyticus TaxID=2961994 RepID=UPI0020C97CAC|nr:hypothetical protein [Natronosalvus amylolyticus]